MQLEKYLIKVVIFFLPPLGLAMESSFAAPQTLVELPSMGSPPPGTHMQQTPVLPRRVRILEMSQSSQATSSAGQTALGDSRSTGAYEMAGGRAGEAATSSAASPNSELTPPWITLPIGLDQAIVNALTNKQVIHSLDGKVSVELTTPLDPLIAAEQVQIAAARFDPTWRTAFVSDHIDLPPSSFTPDGLPVATNRDEMEFLTRITKEWATGGTTSIGYEPSLAYLFFPQGNPGGFNPSHAATLVFQGTQPLMRNSGRAANLANIRIANVREQQSVLLVQAKLQAQLRGIVSAYWNLHAAHVRYKALTEAIVLAEQMYQLENRRYKAGRVIFADVARVGVNKEDLIQQRLDTERSLRLLTLQISQVAAIPIDNNTIIYPTDIPIHTFPILDTETITALAMNRNPSLQIQRNELSVAANDLLFARNQLKPQLDLKSAVRSGGLNDDLGNALKDMSRVEFVDVSVGIEYSRPIGNRAAQAKYKQLQLAQARTVQLLDAFEQNVAYDIADKVNSVGLAFAKFESSLRQLAESQEWVRLSRTRYENPPDELGPDALLIALVDYQNAIQAHVNALFSTAQGLSDYNAQLCEIAELEGILLENWGINLQTDL
jgi:HAE1 family hydrophobic/amphiphilic exporter-1